MPRAFDRFHLTADKDPLRTTLNFEDPMSHIGEAAEVEGQRIRGATSTPLQGLFDGLVSAFTNDTQTGWDGLAAAAAAAQARREQTEIAAAVQEMLADRNAQYVSGSSTTVAMSDFSGTAMPDVFTKFSDTGLGAVYRDDNSIQMENETGRELYVFPGLELQTNQFEVSVIAPTRALTYFGAYYNQFLYLIARANDPVAPTSFVFMRFSGNRVRVGAVKAGSGNDSLDNPYWFGPEEAYPWGSYLTFRGGLPGNDHYFQLLVNNKTREVFEDLADFSMADEDHRLTGIGFENQKLDSVNRSFGVSHFTVNDNAPPPVVGVGCKLFRANPGVVGMEASPGTGYELTDLFDTPAYINTDFFEIVDLAKGLVRVKVAGHYDVDFSVETNATLQSVSASIPPHIVRPYIRRNDADGPRGNPSSSARDGLSNILGVRSLNLHRAVYFAADDVVSIRYTVYGPGLVANGFVGDALGNLTSLTLTLLNRSTA